jgi:hypothetical protein
MLAETSVASVSATYKSATRIDIALLVSALFLQRFTVPYGHKAWGLNLVPIVFILLHQILSGKILIQYDRLFWFLAVGLAVTCSLLLNFQITMLTSYSIFVFLYSFLTLIRPSTRDRYKSTLQAFQFLVIILSALAVAQFVAQFVVDGRKLIAFYGIVPDLLLDPSRDQGASANPRNFGGILKSNGMFLAEPSTLSQITAIGILIEVLEFGRLRYLLTMTLGFLVAYSGTGLMTLFLFLPLASLRHGRASLSALLAVMFALGLLATGIIDLSVFTSRIGEFEYDAHMGGASGGSGFYRFIAPFWLAAKEFDTASWQSLLLGNGPGTVKTFGDVWYRADPATWWKLLYEYGIIGSFVFVCFLVSCLRRSRCPGLVLSAQLFTYVFHGGAILNPASLTIMMVLCTLHGPESRRGRIDEASRYVPSLVPGSSSG